MEFKCDCRYMILPVNHNAKKKKLKFYENSILIYDLDIELDFINPDLDYYLNIERFWGMKLEIECEPEINMEMRKSDIKYFNEEIYNEKYRPGFHFSTKRGWLNDPNGLVYYDSQYLMFYQHNPVANKWGNMHWGYAVSSDLIHWSEKEIALYPDSLGTIFSGSAIVDTKNVTGFKVNENDVILLFYTAAGGKSEISKGQNFTQCLAYSTNRGETFEKYHKNPIISNIVKENRDPKIIYHPQTENYIMVIYLTDNKFALLSSKNLLDWIQNQEIELMDDRECPDFYPLCVDGDEKNMKWVLSGASDKYLLGSFDGCKFKPETEMRRLHYGKNSYASMSWSDISAKDGRRIRIAWNTFDIPSMPFNKCMTFPCEMKLKTFYGEVFLCAYPIREIEKLYGELHNIQNVYLSSGEKYTKVLTGKYYDVTLKISGTGKADFNISVFGLDIHCNGDKNELKCLDNYGPLESYDDSIDLRMLIDITGIEIFINSGKAFMSIGYIQDYNVNRLEILTIDKDIMLKEIKVAEINNIWHDKRE